MLKKSALAIGLLLFCLNAIAQTYWIQKTQFLDFCYRYNGELDNIKNCHSFLPVFTHEKGITNQIVIKNKQGLYILIGGTGKVFKATDTLHNQIAFKRIDSTYYEGYNQGAIDFSYQNNIYSFGGGGLWRITGQLRIFDTLNHEWNSIKINKEYRVSELNYVYDSPQKIIYTIQFPYENVISEPNDSLFTVLKFDIEKRHIESLGFLNTAFLGPNSSWQGAISINLNSLRGCNIIAFGLTKMYLLDFENNQVRALKSEKIRDLIKGRSNNSTLENVFELKNRIYYTLPKDAQQKLQSLTISSSDFSDESIPLYENGNSRYWLLFAALISASIVSIFLYRKKQAKGEIQKKVVSNDFPQAKINGSNNLQFSPIQKEFIEKVIVKISENGRFTTSDINDILGISKKAVEVQRKSRSELIGNINSIWRQMNQGESDFIERLKSEDDKRFTYYTISSSNLKAYKVLLL